MRRLVSLWRVSEVRNTKSLLSAGFCHKGAAAPSPFQPSAQSACAHKKSQHGTDMAWTCKTHIQLSTYQTLCCFTPQLKPAGVAAGMSLLRGLLLHMTAALALSFAQSAAHDAVFRARLPAPLPACTWDITLPTLVTLPFDSCHLVTNVLLAAGAKLCAHSNIHLPDPSPAAGAVASLHTRHHAAHPGAVSWQHLKGLCIHLRSNDTGLHGAHLPLALSIAQSACHDALVRARLPAPLPACTWDITLPTLMQQPCLSCHPVTIPPVADPAPPR